MLKACSLKYMKDRLCRKPGDQQYTGMQSPKNHVTNQPLRHLRRACAEVHSPLPKFRNSEITGGPEYGGARRCILCAEFRRFDRSGIPEFRSSAAQS
jgi:hypothetical protein